jgi:hypothetical protein
VGWILLFSSNEYNMIEEVLCDLFFSEELVFGGTGVWTHTFMLARQVLYHLYHSSITLCSCYFGDRVSLFVQASPDYDPPILCFPLLLGWQAHTTTPSFFPL